MTKTEIKNVFPSLFTNWLFKTFPISYVQFSLPELVCMNLAFKEGYEKGWAREGT